MNNTLAFLILVCITFSGTSQTSTYDITVGHKSIGTLTVMESFKKGNRQIEVVGHIRLQLIRHADFEYYLKSTFDHGTLKSSITATYINGKKHSNSSIERQENSYSVKVNDNNKNLYDSISYSGAELYHHEPESQESVFSEIDGGFKHLIAVGNSHTYRLINTNGHREAVYEYQNGILEKANIQHALFSFTLTKVPFSKSGI